MKKFFKKILRNVGVVLGSLVATATLVVMFIVPTFALIILGAAAVGVGVEVYNKRRRASTRKAYLAQVEAKQEAARLQAEEKAKQEAARLQGEVEAKRQEAARLQAEVKAKQEAARLQAEVEAKQEAARLQAEVEAKQEAARLQAEVKAKQEAARLQAEEKAKQEAARLQAEEKAKQEAARLQAEEKAKQEAARLQAEEKAKQEAARLQAEVKAKQEAARLQAEEKAKQEAVRLQAEVEAKQKSRELAREGMQLFKEGMEAERNDNDEIARVTFQKARIKLEQACTLDPHNLESAKLHKICTLKIEGNELFVEGLKLLQDGNYQKALTKFQEARTVFSSAWCKSKDKEFLQCIEFVDQKVNEVNNLQVGDVQTEHRKLTLVIDRCT